VQLHALLHPLPLYSTLVSVYTELAGDPSGACGTMLQQHRKGWCWCWWPCSLILIHVVLCVELRRGRLVLTMAASVPVGRVLGGEQRALLSALLVHPTPRLAPDHRHCLQAPACEAGGKHTNSPYGQSGTSRQQPGPACVEKGTPFGCVPYSPVSALLPGHSEVAGLSTAELCRAVLPPPVSLSGTCPWVWVQQVGAAACPRLSHGLG
jgi:hypothetical protein